MLLISAGRRRNWRSIQFIQRLHNGERTAGVNRRQTVLSFLSKRNKVTCTLFLQPLDFN